MVVRMLSVLFFRFAFACLCFLLLLFLAVKPSKCWLSGLVNWHKWLQQKAPFQEIASEK